LADWHSCVLLTLNTNPNPIPNPNHNPNPKPCTVIITKFSVVFQQILMYIGTIVCCCVLYGPKFRCSWL